jgi:heme/copper-type cytochrome/quinol oxidase subunit 4
MKDYLKKPWFIFILSVFCIAIPLCVFPINLFQGEIILQEGLVETKVQAPLSLSYFLGLGYREEDMIGIKDFYLLPSGYALASIFLIGIPGLIAYRFSLRKK